MILRPQATKSATDVLPAWEAVAEAQQQAASWWWLVTQPDHARLAGEVAGRLAPPHAARLEAAAVHAIGVHDAGWAEFDDPAAPALGADGRPLSFLEVPPVEFVAAWTRSIEEAAEASAIGGIMVSRHFCRLVRTQAGSRHLSQEAAALAEAFLERESRRQQKLRLSDGRPAEEVEQLVDVLQFCDLVSLYLCCGSRAAVHFPQRLDGGGIALRWDGERCRLEPSPFAAGFSARVRAWRYPGGEETELHFLLR